ncbi:MAG: BrnA antitoxin family protein [Candidatus Obscuribacterales bacterium]|nr:BrnA antitoxin family protein [Candidatus Obscuribacterales bacterium]
MPKFDLEKSKKNLKQTAKQAVAQRGSIQFRLDPEMMSILLETADKKRVPAGVLARMWIVERLELLQTGTDNSETLNNIMQRLKSIESKLSA